jgi:hypothetical protein
VFYHVICGRRVGWFVRWWVFPPMAGGVARVFVGGVMKTSMIKTARQEAPRRDQSTEPPVDKAHWQTATLPRLSGGKAHPGEWRPGESAGRSYERVVADWWWI